MDQNEINNILLNCLSYDPDRIIEDNLDQLTSLDWEALLELTITQQVTSLLYHRIKKFGQDGRIPAAILQRLRERSRFIAMRNLRYRQGLGEIADALSPLGIPLIVLKGVYLAAVIYDNFALREMVDIDILIPKADLAKAAEVMIDMGYQPTETFSNELEITEAHHLPPFIKPNVAVVEIHWSITSPYYYYHIEPTELWDRAVPASIGGKDMLGLSPEDLMLHLCFHTSYQHNFSFGLRPFCDIAETIRFYENEINWAVLQQRAVERGWKKGVYLALRLAKEMVGASVPEEVLHSLKPKQFNETLFAMARRQIFTDSELANSLSPNLARLWGNKPLWEKFILFWKRVFISPRMLSRIYPPPPNSPKIYFYYLVRFRDLMNKYGPAVRHLWREDTIITTPTTLSNWLAGELKE